MSWVPLFSDIVDSSIWSESKETRLVWVTMLAKVDHRTGVVNCSVPGLARAAVVTLEECQEALRVLINPDPMSRSKEHDGRRIEEVDGGWRILNHGKYQEKMQGAERREYQRVKQAEYRARRKELKEKGWPLPGEVAYLKAEREGASQEELDRLSEPPVVKTSKIPAGT